MINDLKLCLVILSITWQIQKVAVISQFSLILVVLRQHQAGATVWIVHLVMKKHGEAWGVI